MPGVRQVTNKLHLGTGHIIEERDLGRRLEDALHWCLEVEPWRISVEVDKGVAYLSGRVPSREYAREAEDLVRWHPEITDVVNRLTVEAPRRCPGPGPHRLNSIHPPAALYCRSGPRTLASQP